MRGFGLPKPKFGLVKAHVDTKRGHDDKFIVDFLMKRDVREVERTTSYELLQRLSRICFELVVHVAVACIESSLIALYRPQGLQQT